MDHVLQCPTQDEIPAELNEQLVHDLAQLSEAPRPFAESTVALLGFGSRALLEELGLIELEGSWPAKITITDQGWRVVDACARWVTAAGEDDWLRCRREDDNAPSSTRT